jgi:hypothetical protein
MIAGDGALEVAAIEALVQSGKGSEANVGRMLGEPSSLGSDPVVKRILMGRVQDIKADFEGMAAQKP